MARSCCAVASCCVAPTSRRRGSRAVTTALIAICDSVGMTATTDNSVTSGRIYQPYMQRSAAPATWSRNWDLGRITDITVKVYQPVSENDGNASTAKSESSKSSRGTHCNRQGFALLAMLLARFLPKLSRNPFAQTDLSLLPSKSARAD